MHYFFTLLIVLAAALPVSASSLPDVIDSVRGSILGVGTTYPPRQPNVKGDPTFIGGTGFVVGDGLHIVTNAHVIPAQIDTENNETLAVFAGSGKVVSAHPARVVILDKEHDLALLQIRGKPFKPMVLGDSSSVREGQDIAFTGFPIGAVMGLFPATHRGTISAITPMVRPADSGKDLSAARIRGIKNPLTAFQLDATAYPGNSGSPVYEASTGKVIGVINSVFVKGTRDSMIEKPSGISFAIPVKHVKELLQSAAILP
jgi:serine protease Do